MYVYMYVIYIYTYYKYIYVCGHRPLEGLPVDISMT